MTSAPLRVLLIEDDLDDVLLLKESLVEIPAVKIKLAHADRLSSGLIQLAEQGYDVILLDLNLPDSRGLETLTTLIKEFPKLPVVVLSGLADDATTTAVIKLGAQDYLVKGEISVPILGRVLRYAIERKQAEETLRASEARYRILVDTSPDGITLTSLEGRLVLCNQQTVRLHGYDNFAAMRGLNVFELIAPEDRQLAAQNAQKTLEADRVANVEYTLLRKDGSRFAAELSAALIRGAEGAPAAFIGITRDITVRKEAEAEIRRQLNRLAALREIDSAITSNADMQIILNTVLAQVAAQLGIDAAEILLVDPHKQVLEYCLGRGFRTEALQHTSLRLGDGYAGRAALGRQLVHIPDLRGRKTDFLRSPVFSQEGFVCYFGAPLIAKGEVKGVLEIFHRSALNPDAKWLDFLETLAGQTAIAIDNSQLFMSLQCSNLELKQAYDATIEGWSQAMDLRDKETEGHTRRVTELTVRLARAMGISEDEIIHVQRGALLHDMGKLGVPDAILLKPGQLTNEEWAIMKQHPQFAYNMLWPIAYLRPALDIPYCHHEKWDGTGYPRGLKGQEIPLSARMFTVIDIWDALTSDRPYRAAWPKEKVLEYIREQSGSYFDPEVVNEILKFELSEGHTDRFIP